MPGIENMYFEGTGGMLFPLTFFTQDSLPMTSFGGEFSAGAGYNWDGWLFGIEYKRDMWGEGVGDYALMQNFNNNIIQFRLQRVLSRNTIRKFPSWFELVPGMGLGCDFITTDYYPSKRAKNEGRMKHVTFAEGRAVLFLRCASAAENAVSCGARTRFTPQKPPRFSAGSAVLRRRKTRVLRHKNPLYVA